MSTLVVAQLLFLEAEDPKKDVFLYVNSPGGSVTATLAMIDTMRHIKPDVATVCVGMAASGAAMTLAAGQSVSVNLPVGTRIVANSNTATVHAGTLIAAVSKELSGTVVTLK